MFAHMTETAARKMWLAPHANVYDFLLEDEYVKSVCWDDDEPVYKLLFTIEREKKDA